MAQFLLLLYDDPSFFSGLTAARMKQVVKEYTDWGKKLRRQGRMLGGQKLTFEGGRVLRCQGKKPVVTDGPYAEAKEVLGGFVLIAADSYDEAVEIARTCPHLKYGLSTHVRQIDEH